MGESSSGAFFFLEGPAQAVPHLVPASLGVKKPQPKTTTSTTLTKPPSSFSTTTTTTPLSTSSSSSSSSQPNQKTTKPSPHIEQEDADFSQFMSEMKGLGAF